MKRCDEFFLKNKPVFLFGLTDINQLKEKNNDIAVAFIGKSNVGKSSLINAITNSKIAKSSKTPGRTRELNFFSIGDRLKFVDMMGYGFALATEEQKYNWRLLIYNYITISKNLKIVFLLIDARKGFTIEDLDFMQILDENKIEYCIILTKIDNMKKAELEIVTKKIKNEGSKHNLMNKEIFTASSTKGYGIFEIRDKIYSLLK